ncbi:ATP-binding protein [Streptomyces sp. NPDC048718]|uniref:ATP-binding protein n=1 Tax=Streptomyces sp. NPDC048718 TaxID=3365587 RepID=UPI00371C01FF
MQVLQVQLEVGADPAEVGRARRWARSRLARSGIEEDEPLAETLVLLISELVTNAVVHTGCPAVLRMLFGGAGVRVEVVDVSDRPPAPRRADGDATNGRGLELVDGLADRWGWQREGAGKSIWCEVDRVEPVRTETVGVESGRAGTEEGEVAGSGRTESAAGPAVTGPAVTGPRDERPAVPAPSAGTAQGTGAGPAWWMSPGRVHC